MCEKQFVGAIDQGTTSTRFILFNHAGKAAASCQLEHKQIYPEPGLVEHDPLEIWEKTASVIKSVLKESGVGSEQIAAIGITNQRETSLVWNRNTGEPYYNAIVWQDTRTADFVNKYSGEWEDRGFRKRTGLPLASYFSGTKIRWILDNVEGVKEAVLKGEAVFGTIDTWLVWQLTGGPGKGAFVTDVSNAGRTLLMDLKSLEWDDELLAFFNIPKKMLPEIRSSVASDPYGMTRRDGPFGGEIPVSGILGDQQAAMFGQACFKPGQSKNTYGTGCFLLANTGTEIVESKHGLLTTPLYRYGKEPAQYALEGSVAIAGSLVQWLRDNLGLIKDSSEIETLASEVEDSGGVYFVPAFSGLFAPYWRPDARGIIAGLTGFVTSSHIARAVLEATAFQTLEIFRAMEKDAGITISTLKVDGGMVVNDLLMQFQSDMLDVPVIRPVVAETTALGAAYAAGLSSGFWKDREELALLWAEDRRWLPGMESGTRENHYKTWKKAVSRTLDWI